MLYEWEKRQIFNTKISSPIVSNFNLLDYRYNSAQSFSVEEGIIGLVLSRHFGGEFTSDVQFFFLVVEGSQVKGHVDFAGQVSCDAVLESLNLEEMCSLVQNIEFLV